MYLFAFRFTFEYLKHLTNLDYIFEKLALKLDPDALNIIERVQRAIIGSLIPKC